MAEWDEEGDENDMEEFTKQPELQWGFMGDADDGKSQPPGFKIPQTLRLFINKLRSDVVVTLVSNPSGMTAPFQSLGTFLFHLVSPCAGLAAVMDDANEEEKMPAVAAAGESEDVKKEIHKLQFPQMEGDTAPSALIPKCCQSIQKYVAKMDGLVAQFVGASSLTPLQEKILD